MIAFFNFNFLFCFSKKKIFFLFLIFFSFFFFFFSFHNYFLLLFFLILFFPLFFSPPHTYPYFFFSFFPSTSSTLQNIPHRALFLPLSFFIFFLPFSAISCHFICKFLSLYPIKTHKLKDHTHNHTIWFSSNKDREMGLLIGRLCLLPSSSVDLLCLHRRLSSSPPLLDLFPTTNDMW